MQPQDIRLRLVIRRHGLPEIKLVWPCSCAEDVTIAKVLEQVNEVIPLESGEWGLEDYAVELEDGKGGSFECLHFQQVGRILKDEDQVIIRSLLTGDLKRRRLSGRHQISDDGRHLIDGLAFGRSWLRTPRDRPHIDLPPRKRVRFSNEVEDDDEEQEQLLLEALPLSQNGNVKNHSNEEEEGIEIGNEEGEDSTADEFPSSNSSSKDSIASQSYSHLHMDSLVVVFRSVFPELSDEDIKSALAQTNKNMRKAYLSLSMLQVPRQTFDQMMDDVPFLLVQESFLRAKENTNVLNGIEATNGLRIESHEKVKGRPKPLIQEVEDSEEIEDSENPKVSQLNGGVSVSLARSNQIQDLSSDETSESDFEESESDSEEDTSSEEASGLDSENDSSDASGNSSSSGEEGGSGPHPANKKQEITVALATQAQTTNQPRPVGLTRTQKRNARRKRNKAFKELGLEQSQSANGDEDGATKDNFLARKEALLAAILNESHEGGGTNGEAEMEDAPLLDQMPEDQPQEMEADINKVAEAGTSEPKDTPGKRSTRVDLGAGRRLVFGALGLKAPSTKADEQKIRDNLMKDVRPLVNPRTLRDDDGNNASEAPLMDEEDPDAWREKIIYKAVECCHEDMVLSEPPFPFVQRWDPQQKYHTMRKRKRASENYQADASYDDSAYCYADEPEEDYYGRDAGEKSKKKKKQRKSANLQSGNVEQDEQDVILNYDEAPIKSSQFTDLDDLPSLPKDIKALPLVTPEAAQPGMVITWNQLLMSKATKWQPELLPITGLIIPGGGDGSVHVMLARRDRENNEKVYDEITGKRIYDKFEAPDLDEASGEEDEEEEDNGFRSLQWTEMLEPRILQQAPVTNNNTEAAAAAAAATEGEMPSGHDQVSELQPEADALESQPSTGQVRAAVENDLMHDSFGTIQSGQRLPRLDLSMSEVQISTASNSFEFMGQLNSNNLAKTGDAQLDHALTAAANPPNAHSAKSIFLVEREDEAAADQEAELAHSLANAVAEGVSSSHTPMPKMAEPSEDQGGEDEGQQTRREEGQGEEQTSAHSASAIHSDAIIAVSQFSIPSGRQPRTAFSMEDGAHHDTLIPETLLHLCESAPQPNNSKSQASSSSRSSPFPSLEEIFLSAQPTQNSGRKMETPSLSTSQVVPARDMEYEEAMRKLDEGHESDASPEEKQEEQEEVDSKVFPNATQPSVRTRLANEKLPALSTSLSQPEKRTNDKSPFAIPTGSQVIVLSSSPGSSSGVPNETNEPEDERPSPAKGKRKLPTGPGWVWKGTPDEKDASNGKRKQTATPSSRANRRGRSEAEAEPLSHAPLVSAVSKYRGRKGR
ncbi:hypothetical protein ACSS6W_004318 [Trichoderma asperelloides]